MLYPDVLTSFDPDSREWIGSNEPPSSFEEGLVAGLGRR